MKSLVFLILAFALMGCDPYGFGFKKNPAFILDEAFQAVSNQDLESFLEVTSKEALCVYGNTQGISLLKEKIQLSPESVNIQPKKLNSTYFQNPMYVGYWSYYNERYQIDILGKTNNHLLLRVLVECDYGIEGQKNKKYINQKPKKYKKKECSLVKIVPMTFPAPQAPEKCGMLMINL